MKKRLLKKKMAILSIAIVALATGVVAYKQSRGNNELASQPTSPINYAPPTAEEEAESEAREEERKEAQEDKKTDSSTQVSPVITNANQDGDEVFVAGYVPGLLEDGGICTATITKDQQEVVKTSNGFINVSSTNCIPITIPRSDFSSAGQWQVVLSYKSGGYSGGSQPRALELH